MQQHMMLRVIPQGRMGQRARCSAALPPARPLLHRRPLQPATRSSNRRRQPTSCSLHAVIAAAPTALQELTAAAVRGAAGLPALLHSSSYYLNSALDPGVLNATVGACFKLSLICAVVGWLLKTQRIPNATATVLSQLSFQLLIPCQLFAKVAEVVTQQPDLSLLGGVALCTLLQVALGALFGLALSPLVDGQYSQEKKIFGWHPLQPAQSAAAIAAGTAAATGVLAAAPALLPRVRPPPAGFRQLVAAACAFGNSFTLPCVFFLTLLPGPLADASIAYAALFMLAWSPCIFSVGKAMLAKGMQADPLPAATGQQQQQQKALAASSSGRSSSSSSSDSSSSGSAAPATAAGGMAEAGKDDTTPHRHLFIFDQLVPRGAAQGLRKFVGQVVNPPFIAIIAGLVVGLTPLGGALFGPAAASAAGSPAGSHAASEAAAAAAAAAAGARHHLALPFELSLLRGAIRSTVDVIQLLAQAALGVQTVVLASSLLQRPEGEPALVAAAAASRPLQPGRRWGWLGAAARFLLPADAVEGRALAVIALTRFLLVPLSTLAGMQLLGAAGLLPGGAAGPDPILMFMLLVQSVMPSAQNLIVLLQLSPATQKLAPGFSRLLLKLYAYAALPVTVWITGFATQLSIPTV